MPALVYPRVRLVIVCSAPCLTEITHGRSTAWHCPTEVLSHVHSLTVLSTGVTLAPRVPLLGLDCTKIRLDPLARPITEVPLVPADVLPPTNVTVSLVSDGNLEVPSNALQHSASAPVRRCSQRHAGLRREIPYPLVWYCRPRIVKLPSKGPQAGQHPKPRAARSLSCMSRERDLTDVSRCPRRRTVACMSGRRPKGQFSGSSVMPVAKTSARRKGW